MILCQQFFEKESHYHKKLSFREKYPLYPRSFWKYKSVFRIIQQYGFIFGLVLVIGLAIGNVQSMETVSLLSASNKWLLIAVIFAFQGLGLSKDALSQSCKPIQLPIFVLLWNFLGFPLLVASTLLWWISPSLQMGFFFYRSCQQP